MLKESGANRVLDLGCGEGKVLRELLRERTFTEIVGVDVSFRAPEIARERLHWDRLPPAQQQRVKLPLGWQARSAWQRDLIDRLARSRAPSG